MKRFLRIFLVGGLVLGCLFFSESAQAEERVYYSVKDTYTKPATGNVGSESTFLVEYGQSQPNFWYQSYGFIKFEDLNLDSNVTIQSAEVVLRVVESQGNNCNVEMQRQSQNWSETGTYTSLTYSGSSAYDTKLITGIGEYRWNVTQLVQAWVNGTSDNHGVVMATDAGALCAKYIASREYGDSSLRPQLIVSYALPTPTPTVTSTPTPTVTPIFTPTPTAIPTKTPTPTSTVSLTPTVSVTMTPEVSPTRVVELTVTPVSDPSDSERPRNRVPLLIWGVILVGLGMLGGVGVYWYKYYRYHDDDTQLEPQLSDPLGSEQAVSDDSEE